MIDFKLCNASFLINRKFGPFEIAKRLGHIVQELAETYSHWFIESQHDMVNEIDRNENKFKVNNKVTIGLKSLIN